MWGGRGVIIMFSVPVTVVMSMTMVAPHKRLALALMYPFSMRMSAPMAFKPLKFSQLVKALLDVSGWDTSKKAAR